ncbi:MAG: hypothetical protein ABIL22_02610, partial [candidate division WOR-3 bacterium]
EIKITFSHFQKTEKAKIEIFDILGRRVKEFLISGCSGVIQWEGVDDGGAILPSGVYFIHLSDFKSNQSVPAILLR